MDLSEQYRAQARWREWPDMIGQLPLSKDQVVLDLGCGPGVVASLLSRHVSNVIGIDINHDLIEAANATKDPNAEFLRGNVEDLSWTNIEPVDGIWSSFTAAYFCDFKNVLDNWLGSLKSGGWVAIVEIADLFLGHSPLPADTRGNLFELSKYMRESRAYDVDMGKSLAPIMQSAGLKDVKQYEWDDQELSFQGAASDEILKAWEQRFERLSAMKRLFDDVTCQKIKSDFLTCLASSDHKCSSKVVMVTAIK